MKLKTKLFVLYGVTSFLILMTFGVIFYVRQWNDRLQQIQDSIALKLHNFDSTLQIFFSEVEGDVNELSGNDVVRLSDDSRFTSFLNADPATFAYHYTDAEQKIIQLFNTHRQQHEYVSSVYMGRENGSFVRSHPRELPTRYDPRSRPWYQLAMSNPGKVVKTDAYSSVTTKDINIGVVKTLQDGTGKVCGVVGIDVTLVQLTNLLLDSQVGQSGSIFLVDRQGIVLASQNKSWLGKNIQELSPALPHILESGNKGIEPLEIEGKRNYVFHEGSQVETWSVAVIVPALDIVRDIRGHILWAVLMLIGGLLLLSALSMTGLVLFVTNPLKKLTTETEIITESGQLNSKIDIHSQDEIGELADSFRKMVGTMEQARQSLLYAHRQLENIIEFLPDATYVIDEAKRVIAWNRNCVKLTGVKKEDILGQGDYSYAIPFYGKRCPVLIDMVDSDIPPDPEHYSKIYRFNEKVFAEAYNTRLLNGEGAYVWGIAGPLYDQEGRRCGSIEVFRDITEQKNIELALQESEKKYRELVELANSIILRWTKDGYITFMNEFGLNFFGFQADDLIGRHVMGSIVPSTDSSGHNMEQLMTEICADPEAFQQSVNENIRHNGERVWIAWTNRIVVDEQGEITQILSVGTDITPLKRAEEAIRDLNINLEHRVAARTAELAVAKERAESADRLKSAFLATMSHELRTPLNSIIGFTGILLQSLAGPLNPEQQKQMQMVRNSARHLLSLINDVLDISKIEAGQLNIRNELFNLQDSIDKVVGIVAPLVEKSGLSFDVVPLNGATSIMSDQKRFEQILLNLLNNAVKFTEHGSITLKTEITGTSLRVSVEDTGIGIKDEDRVKLFAPFQQIDSGLSRLHEGTGLGLAICRRLVDLMGGSIKVESQWGKGSVFSFSLPLNPASDK
jgi:PAS domain S-box-containing protein